MKVRGERRTGSGGVRDLQMEYLSWRSSCVECREVEIVEFDARAGFCRGKRQISEPHSKLPHDYRTSCLFFGVTKMLRQYIGMIILTVLDSIYPSVLTMNPPVTMSAQIHGTLNHPPTLVIPTRDWWWLKWQRNTAGHDEAKTLRHSLSLFFHAPLCKGFSGVNLTCPNCHYVQ